MLSQYFKKRFAFIIDASLKCSWSDGYTTILYFRTVNYLLDVKNKIKEFMSLEYLVQGLNVF